MTCAGSSGFALKANLKFVDLNPASRSPKFLKNISKSNLIIADFQKNNHLIINLKQLVSEFF